MVTSAPPSLSRIRAHANRALLCVLLQREPGLSQFAQMRPRTQTTRTNHLGYDLGASRKISDGALARVATTECLEANESFVHLKAPAGAGKTFVGLHVALDRLQSDSRARLLFVARNEALCLFVVRWICTREKNALRRVQMLRRVLVFFEPFSRGPR